MPTYRPHNQKKDLTDALVDALPPHDGKGRSREYEVRDTRTTGLMVSVSKTGKNAWRFRYTVDGRKRGTTLGTFPALRVAMARQECGGFGVCWKRASIRSSSSGRMQPNG